MTGPAYHGRTHGHDGTDPSLHVWEDTGTGAGSGGGIQFDTYPQSGGWLYVEATDETGSPNGFRIELRDTMNDPTGAIMIQSDYGEIDISAGDQVSIFAGSNMILDTDGVFDLNLDGGISADVGSTAQWRMDSNIWLFDFTNAAASVQIRLSSTMKIKFFADGKVAMPALPTSAGASGELYVDGSGFVKRA